MNTSVAWVVGILVVLAAGAGIYVAANPGGEDSMQKDAMVKTDDSMMKDEGSMMDKPDDAMMEKEDAMMKKDDGAMMTQ